MNEINRRQLTKSEAMAICARRYELAKIGAAEILLHLTGPGALPLGVAGYKSWEEVVRDQAQRIRNVARANDDELARLGFLEDEG